MKTANPTLARNALLLDAAFSGVGGLVMAAGAGFIASLTELPQQLLFWAGLSLIPWTAFCYWAARNASGSRKVVSEIAILNIVWVVASFGILLSGLVSPNILGVAFVTLQAAAVAAFATLQFASLQGEVAPG